MQARLTGNDGETPARDGGWIMTDDLDPIVGNWYRHLDKGQRFEVIAVDEDEGFVEIQHFDGDVEEIDLEGWYEMELEGIEPSEDWTGPIDDIEPDDLGYTETDMEDEDWRTPLGEWGTGEQHLTPESEEEEETREEEGPEGE
jgi:hypothetical protein